MFQSNQSKVEPHTRRLTISYVHHRNNIVPYIRLSGKWLDEADFPIYGKVNVMVENNRLVIEPVK